MVQQRDPYVQDTRFNVLYNLLLKLKFLEGVKSKLSLDALSRPRIIIEYPETGGSGFWGKL